MEYWCVRTTLSKISFTYENIPRGQTVIEQYKRESIQLIPSIWACILFISRAHRLDQNLTRICGVPVLFQRKKCNKFLPKMASFYFLSILFLLYSNKKNIFLDWKSFLFDIQDRNFIFIINRSASFVNSKSFFQIFSF